MTANCHADENMEADLINKMSGTFIFVSSYICLDIDKNHFNWFVLSGFPAYHL